MLPRILLCASLLGGALFLPPVPPASAEMSPDIAARVRALGRNIDEAATAAIYAPLHAGRERYADVNIVRDLRYGPDPRHALDIFTTAAGGMPRPVFVFLHGGGFVSGDRRIAEAFYDNVGVWAARNGMVGVNMTYRLAPAHPWPAGAEDAAAAVAWLRDKIAAHGGDPARIFLAGHSAGAAHIADYIAFPGLHPAPGGPAIKGALLLSGIFDVARFPRYPFMRAYYGDNPPPRADQSRLNGLVRADIPFFVAHAELDPPDFVVESKALNEALCRERRCPRFAEFVGHNHVSEIYAIDTSDTAISDIMLEFVKGVK
ncbi:MAG: alpha/beta hydrolase [Xanthobacteraceae bacterium]